jgi:hypothetical protein
VAWRHVVGSTVDPAKVIARCLGDATMKGRAEDTSTNEKALPLNEREMVQRQTQ